MGTPAWFVCPSRRRHTRSTRDWISDVCSSDLDGDPGLTSQAKNHFAGCTRCGINPVDMCERTTAYVMVDADQEALLETFEPGALDAVTLQNNGCFILPVDVVCLNHGVSKRKWPVDPRHSIAEHDLGLLAHGAQNLGAG